MKKMNVKKMLVATLSLATLGVAASGLVTIAPVSEGVVASAESAKPTPATFEMIEGASVRTTAPSGIRFSTYLNKAWIDGEIAAGKTVEVGTLVIPASKLADTTDANFNVDTANVLKYTHDQATQWITDGDYYKVNAVLSDIPNEELATKIAAKSYVKINNVVYDYADAQTRSIAQVAYLAKESGNEAEYLTTVLNTTIADIDVAWSVAEGNYVALPVGGEMQLTVTSTAAEGVTLAETPNLADFGLAFKEGQEGDALLNITDDGKVTAKAGSEKKTANIVASAAGKSAGLNVKVTHAETTNIEDNFYGTQNVAGDNLFVSRYDPIAAATPAKNYEAGYIADGNSSMRVRLNKYSGSGGMIKFNVGVSGVQENNIDDLFERGATSLSFEIYVRTHDDAAPDLYYTFNSSRPTNATTEKGTLFAKSWNSITITKADYEGAVNNGTFYFSMFTKATKIDYIYDLYFDCFTVQGTLDPMPEPTFNSDLEEHFTNGNTANTGDEYFICGVSNGPASGMTKNTVAAYVLDGDSSWEWKLKNNSRENGLCCISTGTGSEWNIDTILNTDGVESVSFQVWSTCNTDLYWNIASGRITTGTKVLTKGAWTTVTITKADIEGLSTAYFSICTQDGTNMGAGLANTTYFSLYFDDIQINYT